MFFQSIFSSLPDLRTERLLLRRVTMGDAHDLFAVSRDPRVAQYVMWSPHASLSDSRAYIRGIQRGYRSEKPSPWGIELLDEKRLIGTIGFVGVNRENLSGEVGYSLGHEFWNQGYATEALRRVIEYGIYSLGLNRIEAQHDVRNPASGRVMEKAGMRLEGTLRDRIFNKGEFVTVALYAVLRRDVPLGG